MLNHIEREVVKAAKAPYRQREQSRRPETPMVQNQNCGGHNAQYQEKNSFEFNPARTSEIFHWKRVMVIAKQGVER
jgi:hypothetical protein